MIVLLLACWETIAKASDVHYLMFMVIAWQFSKGLCEFKMTSALTVVRELDYIRHRFACTQARPSYCSIRLIRLKDGFNDSTRFSSFAFFFHSTSKLLHIGSIALSPSFASNFIRTESWPDVTKTASPDFSALSSSCRGFENAPPNTFMRTGFGCKADLLKSARVFNRRASYPLGVRFQKK